MTCASGARSPTRREDGPAVGDGQKARVSLDGARERAALVTEELASEAAPGQAPAIDRLEPALEETESEAR